MTTSIFSGNVLTQDPATGTSLAAVTLEIISPGDLAGSTYAVIATNTPTALDEISITAPTRYAAGTDIAYALIPGSVVSQDDYIQGKDGNDQGLGVLTLANIPLDGGSGDDELFRAGQIGGSGNILGESDYLANETDILLGGAGNNYLDSAGGVDFLCGGDGNGTLLYGIGDDRLSGGAGADVFKYHVPADPQSTYRRIRDYTTGEDLLVTSYFTSTDENHILATAEQTAFGVKRHVQLDTLPADTSIIFLEDFVLTDLDASDFVVAG